MAARKTFEVLQESFSPYVRSREEAAHIRRVLALHLESCFESGKAPKPLFLVDPSAHSVRASASRDARGLEREYLKAVAANIAALQENEEVRRAATQPPASHTTAPRGGDQAVDVLEEHLYMIRLEQRRERLEAIQKHLMLLADKPAAALDYLDPSQILAEVSPGLPEVPRDVVDGIAASAASASSGGSDSTAELREVVDQLERSVLKGRFALAREERRLADLKRTSPAARTKPTDGARFHALSTARNELIAWIEAELGKAGGGDGANEGEDEEVDEERKQAADLGGDAMGTDTSRAAVAAKLSSIAEQYSAYVALRKELLQTATQPPQPPPLKLDTSSSTDDVPRQTQQPPATNAHHHLVTPQLASLLAIAHEQKLTLQHKAAANVALARQLRDTCLALDRLAAESQLLLVGGGGGGTGGLAGLGSGSDSVSGPRGSNESLLSSSTTIGGAGTAEHLDVATYVRPWLDAAGVAKMATLEAVAEKVEEGQLALEATVATLAGVDELLGKRADSSEDKRTAEKEGDAEEKDDGGDDMWLAAEKGSSGERLARRRQAERRRDKERAVAARPFDIWDTIDGNLGQASGLAR